MDRPRPVARIRDANRGLSTGRLAGVSLAVLATLPAIAVPLAAAGYGIGTNQKTVALIGLAATAVVAAAAAGSSRSIRARDELLAANEELRCRNAELEALHRAVLLGLDIIDERTQGQLWELIEETGDELAELVDEALDERDGDG